MTTETPLNVAPYYDDYDATKNFYKILFKPSLPVQVRELNSLQTLFQAQIERFGDNIFKRGTIINGCNFVFDVAVPYVKILDSQADGESVDVGEYNGLLVSGGNTGLRAYVINTVSGFLATDPNLNTLYLKYTSGGNNTTDTAFVNNEILTLFDSNNSIWQTNILNGSSLFSNNDTVVFVSAVTVTNSSGGNVFANSTAGACTFSAGQTIVGGTSTANLIITEVNTSINSTAIVLKVRPVTSDLSALNANTSRWTLTNGESISVSSGVQSANVTSLIGISVAATLVTDTSGAITNVNMTSRGSGYYCPPYVSVASNTGSLATLSLESQNFFAQVNVAAVTNSVGYAYSFGVTEGVIYQKGFFQRVDAQNIIVSRYANTPDQLSVGFVTTEAIVNSAADPSLLDAAKTSMPPGADRLSLTPTLYVMDSSNAASNDEFFSICQWTNGKPNRQLQQTQYNVIAAEMAQRGFDSDGNYVVDPFFVTTSSPSTQNLETNTVSIVIDPGIAYIEGYRVQSQYNYTTNISKGIDTVIVANNAVSLNYGNYVRVNNLGGLFQFNSGDVVTFYSAAQSFLANTSVFNSAISPTGTAIGTARIRSLVYEGGGDPGTPNAVYRLYLFDIIMNAGKNFRDVRSVYYVNSGLSRSGIADIVTEPNLTTGSNAAVLRSPIGAQNQLVFYGGVSAVKNSNNITYSYRTIKSANCNSAGIIVATLSASDETFPYVAGTTLNSGQLVDVVVIPEANVVATVNATGTVSVNTTTSNMIGTGTNFTIFSPGDYVRVNGGGDGNTTKRFVSIINATHAIMDSNAAFVNSTAGIYTIFPHQIPVPLANRSNRSANINGTGKTLTINLANTFAANVNVAISYSVLVSNATITTKTPSRNRYVKIKANTNPANTIGPWLLGAPDIFRLRGVWQGSNATFDDTNGINVTDHFFIDHNQNEDFYDLGYLYKKPTSNLSIATDDAFIVKFDCFTVSGGAMATFKSYPVDDTKTLAQLDSSGTVLNTLEIPEMFTSQGTYIDLIDALDFRPRVANTANLAPNTSVMTTDPAYPNSALKFGNTANSSADLKFPTPQSGLTCTVENYVGRTDLVIVNSNGNFQIVRGVGGNTAFSYKAPLNSMIVNYLVVPAYPSLPKTFSSNLAFIVDTKISNQKYTNKRLDKYTIQIPISSAQVHTIQPQAYRMEDIANLERRIKTLEYYQSLTLLEASFNQKIIPSSSNTSINRFKFGFFVDNFENQKFSDINNPEYNASIVNYKLTAKKEQLNFVFDFGGNTVPAGKIGTLPYEEYPLLQQLNATDGPVQNTVSNTIVTQTRVCVAVKETNIQYSANGYLVDINSFVLSNTAGPADIYADLLNQVDRVEVYQNTNPNFDWTAGTPLITAENAVVLSSAERANLTSNGALSGFTFPRRESASWDIYNRPDLTFVAYLGNPSYHFKDAGKISWTHNPTNGVYYKIVVKKFSPHHAYYFCYPTDANTLPPVVTPPTSSYNGIFVLIDPRTYYISNKYSNYYSNGATVATALESIYIAGIQDSNKEYLRNEGIAEDLINQIPTVYPFPISNSFYIAADQMFDLKAVNLRPNTKHNFSFNGANVSHLCMPLGGSIGANLVSNANGELSFKFFYSSAITANVTSNTSSYTSGVQYYDYMAKVAGNKVITLNNSDNTSFAQDLIIFLNANVAPSTGAVGQERYIRMNDGYGSARYYAEYK